MRALTRGESFVIMSTGLFDMILSRLNDAPEVFYSLQGEGVSVGSPAVFLRLAGCNLHCTWCDTPHARRGGIHCTPQQVAELLARQPACPRLVVTGGEPLLQMKELEDLFSLLPTKHCIEVETNGSIAPSPELIRRVTAWNVSPKLPHAGAGKGDAHALAAFLPLENAWFKLVVRGEEDWATVQSMQLPPERVLLMPCAADRASYRALLPIIAQMCIRHGVRLSPRLHVELWDTEAGR